MAIRPDKDAKPPKTTDADLGAQATPPAGGDDVMKSPRPEYDPSDNPVERRGSGASSAPRAIPDDANQASNQIIAMTPEMFQQLLTAIAARPAEAGSGDASTNATLSQAILDLIKNQTRGQRQENAVFPEVSAFSYPEGNAARPKPRLINDTWFCGVKQQEDQLTPIEIIAFNNIQVSRTANQNRWSAHLEAGVAGAKGRLMVLVPARWHDDLVGLPSLLEILTQLATGAPTIDIRNVFEEVSRMQAEILAMQKQLAANGLTPAVVPGTEAAR